MITRDVVGFSSSSSSESEEDSRSIAELERDIESLDKKLTKKTQELDQQIFQFATTQPEAFMKLYNYIYNAKILKFDNHRIRVLEEEISPEEYDSLSNILKSFPVINSETWPVKFEKFNIENISKKLLNLAANSRDHEDRSMVGIVAEHGNPKLLQKLIDIGASLHTCDNDNTTIIIYWAICNKLSRSNKNSYEAALVVETILDQNIDIDKICHDKDTPLQYATKHGYIAASNFIKEKIEKEKAYMQGAVIGMFSGRLIPEISTNISSFFKRRDGIASSLTCKIAYDSASEKKSLIEKEFSLKRNKL